MLVSVVGIGFLWNRSRMPVPAERVPAAVVTAVEMKPAAIAVPAPRPREAARHIELGAPQILPVIPVPDDEKYADPDAVEKRDAEEREIKALQFPG